MTSKVESPLLNVYVFYNFHLGLDFVSPTFCTDEEDISYVHMYTCSCVLHVHTCLAVTVCVCLLQHHLLRASSVALSALSVACVALSFACVALSFALSAAISLRRSSLLVVALAASVKYETK